VKRLGLVAAVVVLALVITSSALATTPEQTMYQLINTRRDSAGLQPLSVGPYLQDYAEWRARVIRRNQRLLPHDPCYLCGEVLGVTPGGTWSMFIAWMQSSTHHHILMLPGITRIGCGMVTDWRGYHWWACEVRY
jgi:uncharacterized protein YkwD